MGIAASSPDNQNLLLTIGASVALSVGASACTFYVMRKAQAKNEAEFVPQANDVSKIEKLPVEPVTEEEFKIIYQRF